jgi:hypothetical protein
MPGIAKRIHALLSRPQVYLLFFFLFFCPILWASQDAIVIAEKAIVYADKTMTSPVGYVTRGKKVTVGEVPRNKAQIYPIIVSGKIAYIRTIDVSTEIDSLDTNRLVAERFIQASKKKVEAQYSLSAYTWPTQVSLNINADKLQDKDPFLFNGVQLKGLTRSNSNWDLGIVIGYAEGKENIEVFRLVEIGPEFSYRIYSGDRFIFRWQNQLLGVPFSSYSLGTKARVNGYGFSAGTGLNANWIFGERFGVEAFGGFYYTKLFGFDLPDPVQANTTNPPTITLNPSFVGTRLGIGMTYQY